jgi:DMSO/TMAO reductase YedYZ molybdopterin-dependent catalytic subunit
MTNAALDRLLAVLVLAAAGSGLATLRAGAPANAWVFTLHAVVAGSLAAAVALKLRRSLPRATRAGRPVRLAVGLLLSLIVVTALGGGYLWIASGQMPAIGSMTVLTLHAWAGLVLIPIVAVHLLPRRWRLLRPPAAGVRRTADRRVSRRAALAGGSLGLAGLALAGLAVTGAATLADRLGGRPSRFTGSRWLPGGGVPPSTTFFGEPAPAVDPATWRLRIRGLGGTDRTLSLAELRHHEGQDLTAVLDCTSGWAIETGWSGVPLADLVHEASEPSGRAREVTIRSVTGWSTVLTPDEADASLLAWGVAGRDLPVANGAPLRLVVPDRRGLDWVKWVAEIEVR